MKSKSISLTKDNPLTRRTTDCILFAVVCVLLLIYMGIFIYLNLCKYTQHVDSDIAAEALLAREIWQEKDLTPNTWIASTDRRVLGIPSLASLFYGMSGSMNFSMGISCIIVGGALLAAIAYTLKRCHFSRLGIATGVLALCALPIGGLRNEGQMVPFVMLLWFLFAGYYALHCICLFLCITFYSYLRGTAPSRELLSRSNAWCTLAWLALAGFCGALALGGMRCLQIVILPLLVLEVLLLFFESDHMSKPLPGERWRATLFVLSLLAVGMLARLYPANIEYPLYLQTANGMVDRLTRDIPAAVLECLGISGNCTLGSLSALMQLGIIAVLVLTVYGLCFLFARKKMSFNQKLLLQALGASFLLTVLIETVTTAELAHNYFFAIWLVIMATLAAMISYYEKAAPFFARLITVCVCIFAICNIFYTYKDCVTVNDNLKEYEEVISYMESENISCGYAEFWDASRICAMTDGRLTMGHCYRMEDLRMYWWLTSTKWYVGNLPEEMPTAYIVRKEEKEAFLEQFTDTSIVSLGYENDKFAVYISEYNLVPMT